jgi:hypothetical protein
MSYEEGKGYKLEIFRRDGRKKYYSFNSLELQQDIAQPISIYNTRVSLSSTISTIDFDVENDRNDVETSKLAPGSLVTVQIAKHQSFFADPKSYCFVGYIDFPSADRPETDSYDLNVHCFEAKQGFYDTRILYERNAPNSVIDDPLSQKASDYSVKNHIRRLMTKKDYTILQDVSLADRYNYDTSGISSKLQTVLPNLSYQYSSAGDMADDLMDKVGGIFDMDYTGGIIKPLFQFPTERRTYIVLKNGPVPTPFTDNPQRTSYIVDAFNVGSSSTSSAGHVSRIIGLTRIAKHQVAGSDKAIAFTSLTNKAIGQPFTTNEVDFNGINFTVSKRGEPESPKNRINGAIFTSKTSGSIKVPDQKLTDFHVALDDIDTTPTNVTVNLDDIKTRFINQSAIEFIIIWYQRSGKKGDPNTDENNTILLYRNTNTDGGSIRAVGGDREASLNWVADGPTYAFSVTSALNRIFAVTNYTEAEKIGLVESQPIDLNTVDDINLATRYTSNLLYLSSLYRTEPQFRVTLPDNWVFKPYQQIKMSDYLAYPNGLDIELHQVDYDFRDNNNECSIAGITFLDTGWSQTWPCKNVL